MPSPQPLWERDLRTWPRWMLVLLFLLTIVLAVAGNWYFFLGPGRHWDDPSGSIVVVTTHGPLHGTTTSSSDRLTPLFAIFSTIPFLIAVTLWIRVRFSRR